MGGAVAALINQIVIMFILMAIGYALYRMKIIDRKGTSQMANVVIYVAYPCITLRTLMVDFDPNMIRDAGFCFVLTVVVTLISIPLTRLSLKRRMASPVTAPSSPTAALSGFPLLWACSGPNTSSTSPSESHASHFSFGRMAYGWFRAIRARCRLRTALLTPISL